MSQRGRAKLFINDIEVGDVAMQGSEDSWSHGCFHPNTAFAQFALLFGRWSLFMHVDGEYEPLSEAASSELRQTEYAIDRLQAKLLFHESHEWMPCTQLNIDGELIEWKRG